MARYLLHFFATLVLIVGLAAAALAPAKMLDLCAQIALLNCQSSGDLEPMRFALGAATVLTAAVLWIIGSMVRR